MTDRANSWGWFILALVVAAGWLVWLLAPVLTPFAVSAVLAYLSDPLVDRLERIQIRRWRLGRTLAVVLVFGLLIALFAIVLLVLVPLLVDQVRQLVDRFPAFLQWGANTALPWLSERLGIDFTTFDAQSVQELLRQYWSEASSAALDLLSTLGRGGQALVAAMVNLLLVPVVTFYLMRDWDALVAGARNLLPRRIEADVTRLVREIDEVLGAFLRGQFMVMVALGLVYSVGLWLVGVDMAFLIGMLAGLLSIVPYLGTFVGLAVSVGVALFQFGDALHLVFVLLVFGVGQSLEGMVLTPNLVGDRIGLHPVVVIFAVLAGGQLFGFLGILLALPVAAALNVLVRHAGSKYRESLFYHETSD